jgi:hypothetical protein
VRELEGAVERRDTAVVREVLVAMDSMRERKTA